MMVMVRTERLGKVASALQVQACSHKASKQDFPHLDRECMIDGIQAKAPAPRTSVA